jgi:type II secretory pathway component GspD/PulD (secretin)
VVRTFAELVGVSIVLGPGADGLVDAEIHGQPWALALRAIAGAHGLAVHEVAPGILRLDPAARSPDAGEAIALATRVFRLSYLPAADAGRILEGLASARGRVAVSEHASAVIVTDTPERIRAMARVLGHAP